MVYWVFDYDNTLYHPDSRVLDKIDVNIEKFISNTFSVSGEEAQILREKYYREYGTTIQGLMANHAIKPDDYFSFIMNDSTVPPINNKIKEIIDKLPGKKSIFSNGIRHHIQRGLKILNLENTFEHIFDVSDFDYVSKPNIFPYKFVEDRLKTDKIIFIDDSLVNVKTAVEIGWIGVYLDRRSEDCTDYYRDVKEQKIPQNIIVIKELEELLSMEII